jgi:hypothetical protein
MDSGTISVFRASGEPFTRQYQLSSVQSMAGEEGEHFAFNYTIPDPLGAYMNAEYSPTARRMARQHK